MPRSIGLIAVGATGQAFLARLSGVRDRLGPVHSPTRRAASRIVNSLRAGIAVTDLAVFSRCAIVLIAVPDAALAATLSAMFAAKVNWARKTIVLCNSLRDSTALSQVRDRGAHIASLDIVPSTEQIRFVAEGDAAAISELRRILGRANLLVLEGGGKARYQAGILFATELTLTFAAGAVESLRAAGLTRPQSVAIVESLVTQMARSYGKAGPRSSAGLPPSEVIAEWIVSLDEHDACLGRLLEKAVATAVE